MSDEIKPVDGAEPVETSTPTPAAARRSRVGWFEPEMYIEDIIDKVPNKYLAINVAARRARELNQMSLPIGERAKQARKPTTQALLELTEGVLTYERIDLPADDPTVSVGAEEPPSDEFAATFDDLMVTEDAENEADEFDVTGFDGFEEDDSD